MHIERERERECVRENEREREGESDREHVPAPVEECSQGRAFSLVAFCWVQTTVAIPTSARELITPTKITKLM